MEVVGRHGYAQAKIGDIAADAGVSRATFYQLFTSKEACFLAAYAELTPCVVADAAGSVAAQDPTRATSAAFRSLVDLAEREPLTFNFLTHEALLAGPSGLDQRDRLLAEMEEVIDQAHANAASGAALPDVPTRLLLGALIRLLGIRTRRRQLEFGALLCELDEWVDRYRVPGAPKASPSLVAPAGLLDVSRRLSPGVTAPEPLPRGRHRLPAELVERVQRERILHATAAAIRAKGYANTTVADIVATAGLSREVFYANVHSRPEAFTETHQLIFEEMMAASAAAFFTCSGPWPEQVWESMRALAAFIVNAPDFAHFAFVESYALGESIAQRTDEGILAFTVFLSDGSRYVDGAAAPPPAAQDAIAMAAMEMASYYVRHERAVDLVDRLPLLTYVILAPYLGRAAARGFIEDKLRELAAPGAARAAPSA